MSGNNNNIFSFGNNNNNNTQNNIFQNQTNLQSVFQNNQNNNQNQYLSQLYNNQLVSSYKASLILQPSNMLKYSKIGSLDNQLKDGFIQIQNDIKENQNNLASSENILNKLKENFKVLNNQTQNTASYINMISIKNKKIQIVIQNLKNELLKLNQSLEKEKNNYNILERQENMKVSAPNDFLLNFVQELEDRLKSYASQLNDIKTLINLTNSEENGGFKYNSDMIEQLICELFKNVKFLLEKDAILNEKVQKIKNSYYGYMRNIGFSDYQINNRIENFLKDNVNVNNNQSA